MVNPFGREDMGEKLYPPLSKRESHLLWCAATLATLVGTPGRIAAELFHKLIDRLFSRPRHRLIVANLKHYGYIRPGRDETTYVILRTSHPHGRMPIGEDVEDEIIREDLAIMADVWRGREPDPKAVRRRKRERNRGEEDEEEDE